MSPFRQISLKIERFDVVFTRKIYCRIVGASTELKEGMRSFGQLLTWSIYSILTYTMITIIYRTSSACGWTWSEPKLLVFSRTGSYMYLKSNLYPNHFPVLCDLPVTPGAGSYTQETDGEVTTTTYTCSDGYGLSGLGTSNCRSDGTWDSATPTCGK